MKAGPLWPGCRLPLPEDIVDVDESILRKPLLAQDWLGIPLAGKGPEEVMNFLSSFSILQ